MGNLTVDREISSTLTNFVTQLAEVGCRIEQQVPQEFDFDAAWETYGGFYAPEILTGEPAFSWDNILFTLIGSYDGAGFDNNLRFTRIWTLSFSGTWQIVAAHSSVVI